MWQSLKKLPRIIETANNVRNSNNFSIIALQHYYLFSQLPRMVETIEKVRNSNNLSNIIFLHQNLFSLLPRMIETVENVRNFSSKFEQLIDRSDRQVDVDGRHEVDEPISTISIQSQEIAEK
jgi:hypothetical protein